MSANPNREQRDRAEEREQQREQAGRQIEARRQRQERQQQIEEQRQEFAEEAGVDPGEVVIREDELRLTEEARQRVEAEQREELVGGLDPELVEGAGIDPGADVVEEDGTLRLRESAQERVEEFQRTEVAEEFDADIPEIDIGQEDVVRVGDEWRVSSDVSDELEERQLSEVARDFDEAIPDREIGRGDIVVEDGELTLDPAVREDIEQTQRAEFAAEVDAEIEFVDIGEGDVIEEDGALTLAPSVVDEIEQEQLEMAAEELDETVERVEIRPEMLEIQDGEIGLSGDVPATVEQAIREGQLETVASETDPREFFEEEFLPEGYQIPGDAQGFVDGFDVDEDFEVVSRGGRIGVELTEEAQEERIRESVVGETGIPESDLDIQIQGGQLEGVQLTEEARQRAIESDIASDLGIDPADVDAELRDPMQVEQERDWIARMTGEDIRNLPTEFGQEVDVGIDPDVERRLIREDVAGDLGIDPVDVEEVNLATGGVEIARGAEEELFLEQLQADDPDLDPSDVEFRDVGGELRAEIPEGGGGGGGPFGFVEDLPGDERGLAAGAAVFAVPEPTPATELAGLAIIGGTIAGGLAYDRFIREETEGLGTVTAAPQWNVPEIERPEERVTWDQQEIETPVERIPWQATEISAPEQRIPWQATEVATPAERIPWQVTEVETPSVDGFVVEREVGLPQIEAAQLGAAEERELIEEVDAIIESGDIEDISELQRRERSQLARQRYEQRLLEIEELYGSEIVRETIVERVEQEPFFEEQTSPGIEWQPEESFGDVPLEEMVPEERRRFLWRLGLRGEGIETEAELQEALQRRESAEEAEVTEGDELDFWVREGVEAASAEAVQEDQVQDLLEGMEAAESPSIDSDLLPPVVGLEERERVGERPLEDEFVGVREPVGPRELFDSPTTGDMDFGLEMGMETELQQETQQAQQLSTRELFEFSQPTQTETEFEFVQETVQEQEFEYGFGFGSGSSRSPPGGPPLLPFDIPGGEEVDDPWFDTEFDEAVWETGFAEAEDLDFGFGGDTNGDNDPWGLG